MIQTAVLQTFMAKKASLQTMAQAHGLKEVSHGRSSQIAGRLFLSLPESQRLHQSITTLGHLPWCSRSQFPHTLPRPLTAHSSQNTSSRISMRGVLSGSHHSARITSSLVTRSALAQRTPHWSVHRLICSSSCRTCIIQQSRTFSLGL